MNEKINRIDEDEIDWNQDYSIIYIAGNHKSLINKLLHFGQMLFYNSFRFIHFNEFRALNVPLKKVDLKIAKKFASETTVDMFRFVTCFDNYMKAVLLQNNYVIHQINSRKHFSVYNKQRTEPIAFDEIIPSKVDIAGDKIGWRLDSIVSNTLSPSIMLKEKYQEVIGMGDGVVKILMDMVEYRNKHHLYISEGLSMSKKVIDDMQILIDFVDKNILKKLSHDDVDYHRIRTEDERKRVLGRLS
jgi:hypothetical protein